MVGGCVGHISESKFSIFKVFGSCLKLFGHFYGLDIPKLVPNISPKKIFVMIKLMLSGEILASVKLSF